MKFIFDECITDKIPAALKVMGKETFSYKEHWQPQTPDEEWIPYAAANGWSVVTSDKIRPHRRMALRTNGGRIFLIATANLVIWEEFKLVVAKWDEIESFARKSSPPFIIRVPKRGKLEQILL